MSHGKRYSAKERKEILDFLENHTYQETMDYFGVSQMSLARWVKNKKKRDTNTNSTPLALEVQKEIKLYLKLLEKSEQIKAAAIVTVAGELIIPEPMGFQEIFPRIEDLIVTVSNFLLCAQGFTSAVVNHKKPKETTFDNISIKTSLGYILIKSVRNAVIVILLNPNLSLQSFYAEYSPFFTQILMGIKDSFAEN
jgi:hypothetical protein